ncbi:MAG: hypothetical protein RIT45_3531 [Pseudomonadota bacterium]|jgi:parallel beta-helix repeat protein
MRSVARLSSALRQRPVSFGLAAASLGLCSVLAGCSTDDGDDGDKAPAGFSTTSCLDFPAPCLNIAAGQEAKLQEESQLLGDGTTIVLGEGTFVLDNQVTIRQAKGVTLIGQGIDKTILNFGGMKVQANGVDVIGDDFRIEGLTIEDAKKDALRVEDSDGVTIRKVKVTWTAGPKTENGAYGLYPVKCVHVLVEDCEAWNASDAGLYVGQSRHVVVRNNLASGNVAGIEIENTQFADVYGNTATNNTAGLAVFDLPGNPVIGRDIHVHDNIIEANNMANFAPGGTVAEIPAGTGTFILASRRVQFDNNIYKDNVTVDIAILNGLAIEGKASKWRLANDKLVGDSSGLDLPSDATGVSNYRTSDILIRDNTHSGGGANIDGGKPGIKRQLGLLLSIVYGSTPVDSVVYDGWGESSFDAKDASKNTNDNRVCLKGNTGASVVNLHLDVVLPAALKGTFPKLEDLYRPAAPFAPYDCDAMQGGPIAAPTMPQLGQ